ncbi:MAG: DUF799 domain-containing protein [Candidatus Cloacimonetes bacterium]|nr:DUF799 domain-containing protein [Candidatus Cloacimonadota bacterium]
MNKKCIIILVGILILLAGCSVNHQTKAEYFPLMYSQRPVTVLILPPENLSTAPEAKEYLMSTLTETSCETGYYFLPLEVTTPFLINEGLYDTEIISESVYPQFKEYFGADAVLITRIMEWDKTYVLVAGKVVVSLEFYLKSTTTGKILWNSQCRVEVDTSSDSDNLLGQLIETAIQTATTDYVPIAKMAATKAYTIIPVGQYHPRYNLDQDDDVDKLLKNGKVK